jgi:penicillin V acylase-like amidase (Ntn superfamily)
MNKAISRLSNSVSGILFLIVSLVGGLSSEACTVFVLTNGKHTYFFNNEDFSNPKTRLWFIPKGQGYYGSAYVGYDDGEPQGGFNTQGLAFDWVTVDTDGYTVDPNYVPEKHLKHIDGNSSQWML